MKLIRVTFHDYRVYAGVQSVELSPPTPGKPVILFGGLNGEGKTTFLEGIQLALYGRRSEVWSHHGTPYNEYLTQSIHRGCDPSGGAMIEVEFEAVDQDQLKTFKVQRSWKVNGGGKVAEYVQVFIDGQLDKLISETWGDQVERFIPARLAGLFFFDGEKIKHYADPQRSQELIERGLLSLLGIDLIDRLGVDLKALEARIAKTAKLQGKSAAGTQLEATRDELRLQYKQFVEESASLLSKHDQQLNDCGSLDRDYEKKGGKLYEQRVKLEAERATLGDRRGVIEQSLIEVSAGVLPLALIQGTMDRCIGQMDVEYQARGAHNTVKWAVEQGKRVAGFLEENKVPQRTRKILDGFYAQELEELNEKASLPLYLETTELGLVAAKTVSDVLVPKSVEESRRLISDLADTDSKIEALDRKLASVPDEDALADVMIRRDAARHQLAVLEGQRIQVEESKRLALLHLEEAEAALHKHLVKQLEGSQDQEDNARVLDHAERVRLTLVELRERLIIKRITSLQEMIRDSYAHLMRKKGMIAKISIDPKSYRLMLLTRSNQEIPPVWLAAGERQLLVVSILWGFARASGRSLPVIIDTPVGRLDSSHRKNLVSHYFPHASHQVILLSTDEEIVGKTLSALEPSIGHSYRLVYDDKRDATTIESGYFKEQAHAH